jgi:hypothetical protein
LALFTAALALAPPVVTRDIGGERIQLTLHFSNLLLKDSILRSYILHLALKVRLRWVIALFYILNFILQLSHFFYVLTFLVQFLLCFLKLLIPEL